MPGLKSKANFGVCVSGGGMRAASLAYGWVRALHEMGILQKARYLSSNSGGSWFTGPFSYTQVSLSKLLGETIHPKDITLKVAKNVPAGSFAAAIAKASPADNLLFETVGNVIEDTIGKIVDKITKKKGEDETMTAWSDAIGDAFLHPFGLGTHQGTVTTLGTKGEVAFKIAQQMPANMPIMTAGTKDRPFPIMLGSLILPNDSRTFFPFEFTPLYYGSPSLFNDTEPGTVGGGFIEPIGFHSKPPTEKVTSFDGSQTVKVDVSYTVPLVQAVGVSSSYLAQKNRGGVDHEELYSVEQFDYWNQDDFKGLDSTRFGDGGGNDNSAITPLLRRGVEFIIAGQASNTNPDTNATHWAQSQSDISGLFGAVPEGPERLDGRLPDLYNKLHQVFPREEYDALYNMHSQRFKEGGPTVYTQTLKVLPNTFLNVKGGYTVKVLWLLNSYNKGFEEQLPKETQHAINRTRDHPGGILKALQDINPLDSGLHDFPLVDTSALDYTPHLATLMSQQASWMVYEAKEEILDILASTPGGVGDIKKKSLITEVM